MVDAKDQSPSRKPFSSEKLAKFIVQSLLMAKVISEDSASKSVEIITEEIEAMKAMGNY